MPSLQQAEHFHRNKQQIPKVILSNVDEHEIIYGARALNKRFPPFLDKPTQDFDIFSPTPKVDATEAEQALDVAFGGDYFYTEPAKHLGTFKVKSRINKESYADYTKPEQKIPHDIISGKKYVRLEYVKQHIKKTLKDPEAKYRHDRDRDALNRIKIYEKLKKARLKKGIKKKAKRKVKQDGIFYNLNKFEKALMKI